MNNVVVHVVSTIISNVIPSAAKSKVVVLYLNEKYGVIIWNIFEEM